MAPCPNINCTTMEHFTHPGHLLLECNAATEFICDGCKTLGTATRFRCNPCDFDLHEYCAKCPTSLSSFMHPPHHLSLAVRKPQGTRTNDRICDVCGNGIEGLFYRCKHCEFDVHPLCTQLPQYLRHALHLIHPLMLQAPKTASWCVVCRGVCNSWRYRCGYCGGFDMHLECVLVSSQVPIPPQFGPPPPFHPPPPPLYGGYDAGGVAYGSTSNPYYNMYNTGACADYQAPYSMGNINYANQAPVVAPTNGTSSSSKKILFGLVGKLASNMIFGTGNVDFSSFP